MDAIEALCPVQALLGEAPLWRAEEQQLWWVDIHRGMFHRTSWASGSTESTRLGDRISFVIPSVDGILVGLVNGVSLLREGRSNLENAVEVEIEHPWIGLNDGKCDSAGRLWFGTLALNGLRRACALYCMRLDGSTSRILDDVTLSNGLGWSPSDEWFYYVDSKTQRIDVFAFDSVTGAIEQRRTFAEIDSTVGMPDGLTVDSEGCIWVALYGGGRLHRYDPQGELMQTLELPTRYPTSCEFGGPDMEHLLITTASTLLNKRQRRQSLLDGRVLVVETAVRGLAPHPCRISVSDATEAVRVGTAKRPPNSTNE